MACWSCERPDGEDIFCDKCGVILPPRGGRNHFDVLNLPRGHDVEDSLLEARYKELAKKLHPDRYVRADACARRFAAEHSTLLNDAYRTLRDPTRRAEYLLSLAQGGTDVHPIGPEHAPTMDSSFLTEMLELQESIGEARQAGKSAELERIAASIRARRAEDLRAVAGHLARVRFYDRVLEAVAGHEAER